MRFTHFQPFILSFPPHSDHFVRVLVPVLLSHRNFVPSQVPSLNTAPRRSPKGSEGHPRPCCRAISCHNILPYRFPFRTPFLPPFPRTMLCHVPCEARRWRSFRNPVMIHPLQLELETALHKGVPSNGGWMR